MIKVTTESFIINSKLIHGNKYNYSLVNYYKAKIKVKIMCKEHGVFEQTPNNHLNGKGCPLCCNNTLLTNNKGETIIDLLGKITEQVRKGKILALI